MSFNNESTFEFDFETFDIEDFLLYNTQIEYDPINNFLIENPTYNKLDKTIVTNIQPYQIESNNPIITTTTIHPHNQIEISDQIITDNTTTNSPQLLVDDFIISVDRTISKSSTSEQIIILSDDDKKQKKTSKRKLSDITIESDNDNKKNLQKKQKKSQKNIQNIESDEELSSLSDSDYNNLKISKKQLFKGINIDEKSKNIIYNRIYWLKINSKKTKNNKLQNQINKLDNRVSKLEFNNNSNL